MSGFNWTRREMLAAGATFGAAGALCDVARAAESVSYITPFGKIIAYAPDSVGVSGGYFAKAGVNVDIIGGNGSSQAVQLVAAGKALVGRTGGIDVVKAAATSNVPIRVVATIAHLSPFWVISSAAKPLDNPKQMAGKTIGVVSRGGGTDNYLDIMLTVGPAEDGGDAPSLRQQPRRLRPRRTRPARRLHRRRDRAHHSASLRSFRRLSRPSRRDDQLQRDGLRAFPAARIAERGALPVDGHGGRHRSCDHRLRGSAAHRRQRGPGLSADRRHERLSDRSPVRRHRAADGDRLPVLPRHRRPPPRAHTWRESAHRL